MDGTSKSMGQDAALQIATELPLEVGRHRIVVPALSRQAQVGLEMRLKKWVRLKYNQHTHVIIPNNK